jgi:hypothetical protein
VVIVLTTLAVTVAGVFWVHGAETEAVQARSSRDQMMAGVREVLAAAGAEPGAKATLSPQQVERLRKLLQEP